MQKTEHFERPLRQSVTGAVFGLATSLLLLASVSTKAEDSIRHLAMVRPTPTRIKAATSPIISEPVRSSPALLQRTVALETSVIKAETDPNFSTNPQIARQTNPDTRSPLEFVHGNLNSNHSMVVAAGYGQLWNNQSMFKHISSQRQEPGCAYVKASLNF